MQTKKVEKISFAEEFPAPPESAASHAHASTAGSRCTLAIYRCPKISTRRNKLCNVAVASFEFRAALSAAADDESARYLRRSVLCESRSRLQ